MQYRICGVAVAFAAAHWACEGARVGLTDGSASADADVGGDADVPGDVGDVGGDVDVEAEAHTETSGDTAEVAALALPDGLDRTRWITEASEAEVLSLCEWSDSVAPEGCLGGQACLVVAGLVRIGNPVLPHSSPDLTPKALDDRVCALTVGEYAECILAAAAVQVCGGPPETLAPAECAPVAACFIPASSTPLRDLQGFDIPLLCSYAIGRTEGFEATRACAGGAGGAVDRAQCVASLGAAVTACLVDPAAPMCDAPASELHACIEQARLSPCAPPAHAVCALFTEPPPAPAPETPLAKLDVPDALRVCHRAGPAIAMSGLSLACAGAPTKFPYFNPASACQAEVGALGCFCETGLAGPGSAECTASVADLTTCSEAPVGACNKVSQSPCVPALLTDSGVNKAATISATSDADLSAWCRWRTCLGGGPGHIPIYCDHNRASATIPSVEACVADLKQTFGGCAATLAGVEACVVAQYRDNDPCHRIGRFANCHETGEFEPCHIWAMNPECQKLILCQHSAGSRAAAP